MEECSPPMRVAFGRTAWVEAALEIFAQGGTEAVRVELLARKLRITKGSFYHHFKDRDDLLATMLEQWRHLMVTEIMHDLEQIHDPRARFHALMRLPQQDHRADLDMELAIRLWARRDAQVSAVLAEIDALRLAFIAQVLQECGVPANAATARALLAFAYLRAATGLSDEASLAQCEKLLLSR